MLQVLATVQWHALCASHVGLLRQRVSLVTWTEIESKCTILHEDAASFDGLSEKLRIRWWTGIAERMRQRSKLEFGGIFPQLEDRECEHAGCEFIRMQRRLHETVQAVTKAQTWVWVWQASSRLVQKRRLWKCQPMWIGEYVCHAPIWHPHHCILSMASACISLW